jgi:hypothetical protein
MQETLRAFGALLEDSEAAPEEMGPFEAIPPGKSPVAKPGLSRPPPRDVNVDDRLADSFEQIEFNAVPLNDFLAFLADYSTIPITLDPDVLPWFGLTPAAPVSIRSEKATVADVLEGALAPLKLGFVIVDDQLLVTRVAPPGAPLREVDFDLSDLAADDGQLVQIREMIQALIAPESWSAAGGSGTVEIRESTLGVRQPEVILFEVLSFVERLRVARGKPLRRGLDPGLFDLGTRLERIRPRLAQPVSVSYLRPTRFSKIVRRIADDTGTHLLIDWRTLADVGWNPDAEVKFTVADVPLDTALSQLLDPMDLDVRVVDGTTLQITTTRALEQHVDLEFYQVADLLESGLDAETLIQNAKDALGEAAFRENGGLGALRLDAPSQYLLAALPQPQQRELAELLAEMRGGG